MCTKCYIKGVATAELTIDGDFDAGLALEQTRQNLKEEIQNFTDTLDDYFIDYSKGVMENISEDGIDVSDFAFPTFDYNFDMDFPAIPECNLRFQFDGMELYMLMDTTLSAGATYKLNLYSSNTPLGLSITKDLEIGIIFSVDLILTVEGEINISSGFHIRLEDGAAIDITLFAKDISDIIFKGAQFEFLPVTVESAGVVFSAVLRVGVHAGFNIVSPSIPPITVFNTTLEIPSVGGGIEVGVFANVAEFITNITLAPEEDCKLKVVQSYQLALGAAAGATINIGSEVWGPVATTSIPIWNTELAEICAIEKTAVSSPTITPSAKRNRRQEGLTTTTITTEVTYTGVSCISPGLVNCPNSFQQTTQVVETKTIVTTVPSGEDFTLPPVTQNSAPETIAFGSNAVTAPETSGSPVSYVPPPPKTTDKDGNIITQNDKIGDPNHKADKNDVGLSKKAIIGISVGLGIPFLFGVIGIIMYVLSMTLFMILSNSCRSSFCARRRTTSAEPGNTEKPEAMPMMNEPYEHHGFQTERYVDKPMKARVTVTETGRAQ